MNLQIEFDRRIREDLIETFKIQKDLDKIEWPKPLVLIKKKNYGLSLG